MEKTRKMSMVRKVTLIVTLLLIIPVAALCAYYIETFQVSLTNEAENNMQTALLRMETNIENSVNQAISILDEFRYKQELSYFLDDKNHLSEKEINFYISSIQSERSNIKYIYSGKFNNIGIYSSNEQISQEKASDFHYYMRDLEKKPYYDEIITNDSDTVFGAIRITDMRSAALETKNLNIQETGSLVLPIYRKIYNLNTNELAGVVELDIDVIKLADKQALEMEDSDINSLLLTPEKTLLFSTEKMEKELEEQVKSAIQGKKGSADLNFGHEKYMLIYNTSETAGVVKAVLLPTEDMMKYVQDKAIKIIIITVVCLAILVIITYCIMNNMLKRLVILDQMMGKVGEGDFKVEITDNGKIEDEVSRITKTFNKMASRLEQVIDEKVEGEKTKKDAELRALQAQINPHFLYNTLENMRMQCEIDGFDSISESLSVLGELFRYSVSWGGNEVPFEMEWKNLKDYLHIMSMRFEGLTCNLSIDGSIKDATVPKLILQPLVENSFNHGFKNKLPPWELSIKAYHESGKLIICIEDNGTGIEEERMKRVQSCLKENKPFRNHESQRTSIGVINVKQRIDMLCKEGSGLEIENKTPEGIRIVIQIVI